MHLLAAKPGGFVDEEGIIDLQQDPAEIVILSAADSQLAALSAGLASSELASAEAGLSVRIANWMALSKPAAYDLYEHKVLQHATLVVVSLLGGRNYWPYGFERLCDWARGAGRTLILVPGDDTPDPELTAASDVSAEQHSAVWRFLRESGAQNSRDLLHYLAAEFFARNYPWQAAKALPRALLYWPESTQSTVTYTQCCAHWQDDSPVVALLFYRSHLQSANTAVFDGLIAKLIAAGLNPLPLAISSLKDEQAMAVVNTLLTRSEAALILNTTGFASNRSDGPQLASQPSDYRSPFARDIPVLQLVLSSSTEEDWQSFSQGLRARDVAMQVALPELDGRILSRAVSFKAASYTDELAQLDVVRYALHAERADFVIELARRYCTLGAKPNAHKRLAVILANYPTKDGRIGNGVGLDTPNSCINLLRALQREGYPLPEELPENGNALIEQLLQSVTNNPNTLHYLGCWQSLEITEYRHFFAALPTDAQRAVLERWGEPEADIKARDGRLMIAGIRLGETFIGIQPARGYNLDLLANYHDPDLVPPHSYLAFYFWLRHCYGVDALIHVGKHGNLEWLPGKGLALSESCWPDIALGPMPHFYPFIVNDPGEGAQAKRRTQAVIIDHLMPPMTRAESYGELAELEGLVDEFYQAMGMDTRREDWLREQIVEKVKSTHLLEELCVDAGDEEGVLNELDTYLCEIKESQIRHGLHVLGALPDDAKLAQTIVALLRLPRGSSAVDAGLLHNLAADLALQDSNGAPFDPSAATTAPWQGARPEILAQLDDSFWRTEQDTRERLEHLALALIADHVVGSLPLEQLDARLGRTFSRTYAQLEYACAVLYPALTASAEGETRALLEGLSGRFVAPGPSGAPTRGRLDTLPTGRNFFSLDNRSVPSKAAWALGQKSADALIMRHLQEHGCYPEQLGLSVWGTATMRTGGDDIAQAFALMGVRPVWAEGSQRVVDIEVVPAMLLGRPRVDVTLRVSGFFRDAFANVMKLYDSAVQAIAALDEPGDSNVIARNINARQRELQAAGLDEAQAQREASYRVFGSKPGAYGAGLQGLIDERCWGERADLADAYLNWGGYAYGNTEGDGVAAREAFAHQLSNLEVVVQNQDNREHDILDSDDYYQFQGGMNNAVTHLRGEAPQVYHSDHANPEKPVIRTLKEELNRVIRARVLNPKWIEAMREHGYKGAFEMTASVDYMFAYDATTELIDNYQYQQVTDTLLLDPENRAFLASNNPHAMEEMAERLLEACQRGMWSDSDDYREKLQDLLLEMDEQQEAQS